MGRYIWILWGELKYVWNYVATLLSIFGIIYSLYLLYEYFSGRKQLDLTIDQVLVLCGGIVLVFGSVVALVTAGIKSLKRDDENQRGGNVRPSQPKT